MAMLVWCSCLSAAEPATRPSAPKWQARPAPAGTPVKPYHVRIVDYGDDLAWNYNQHVYRGGFQNQTAIRNIDLDKDGQTDDSIQYWEFSLEKPLNPVAPHWDTDATNSRFYGGFVGLFPNTKGAPSRSKAGFSEMCTNVDHPGDNINMMVQNWRQPYRCYGIWLWKKADFLNAGKGNRVSFDEKSRIGLHIARYCTGCRGRFVVRDGDQFYISDPPFQGAGESFVKTGKGDNHTGHTHVLFPAKAKWAKYDPKGPHDIAFDAAGAKFATRTFDDVQVVGYYFAKSKLAPGSTWLKLYAFEASATVHRPEQPSQLLDMVKVPAGKVALPGGEGADVPAFYMSKCEVPYAAWQKVWRWAKSPMFAFGWNYVFDRDGDMGSMDFGSRTHDPNEPATDMTWLDAVAWCNALSEREGKPFVYFTDPEFTKPFRKVRERHKTPQLNAKYAPKVYVDWTAAGYRLPTNSEWIRAAAGSAADADSAWNAANANGATQPVGSKAPNPQGLHDMLGNVWEWCWDVGEGGAMNAIDSHIVLGGDFHHPQAPASVSASRYGDNPFNGNYNIGFRVVLSTGGGGPPVLKPGDARKAVGLPTWMVKKGQRTVAQLTEEPGAARPALEMLPVPSGSFMRYDEVVITVSPFQVAKFETTYAAWKHVRDWAEAHGYEFNFDGDMGSMYFEAAKHVHSPDEPVTRITAYDMYAWCNALSEMEGLTPCYYVDDSRKTVFRKSLQHRETMTFRGPWGDGARSAPGQKITVNWAADGYRLPTMSEWEHACRAGTKSGYYWGNRFDGDYAWFEGNSEGVTHAVGGKKPNGLGLHDMMGNVFERCWEAGREAASAVDTRNPKGIRKSGSSHVRGGSFRYPSGGPYARYFRSNENRPNCGLRFGYPEIGFRVVRSPHVPSIEIKGKLYAVTGPKAKEVELLKGKNIAHTGQANETSRTIAVTEVKEAQQDATGVARMANPHPMRGKEAPTVVILDVDTTAEVDTLQGATFRGNQQRTGVFRTTGVPELRGEKWKFKTGGPVKSSPVMVNGVVYVGSDDGLFYAVDAETGREKWKFRTRKPILCSPTVADGVVYFGSGSGRAYALDAATGAKKWESTVRGALSVDLSPIVAYGAVFVQFTGYGYSTGLYALDAKTGKVLRRYRGVSSPSAGTAFSFWKGKLIYGARGSQGSRGGAIDIRTGRQLILRTDRTFGTSAVVDNTVYGIGMCLSAVDFKTGRDTYRYWIEGEGFQDEVTEMNESRSSVAVADGTAFFGNETGFAYAYDIAKGKRKWKVAIGNRIQSPPSVAGGLVYMGSHDGHLYALDAATGRVKWKFKTAGPIVSSPYPADGIIFVGSNDGHLYAVH
jgi:outer membrane protein assembly factor BamB/formylglycine-generating enzyme required for sulfatase activity